MTTSNEGLNPMADVGEAIRELGAAGYLVAEEVKHDREQRRRTDRVVMILLVALVLAVAAVGYFGYGNYKMNRLIADCTTPGRTCYEAAKMQAAMNRSALTRANLAIVACTGEGARAEDALRDCVEQKLLAQGIDISLISPNPATSMPPASTAPTGPPADATIEPPSSDQPQEPTPAQPPVTEAPTPADNPPAPDDTGGSTP